MISLIAAMSKNRVIGIKNRLPWKLPADMARFINLTREKPVIMGRTTYESIGRPLKNRLNIILTTNKEYKANGCEVVFSPGEAIEAASGSKEIMIIGGSKIYELFLPFADRIYLTNINQNFKGDTYFPKFENDFMEISREDFEPEEKNKYKYSFLIYERK